MRRIFAILALWVVALVAGFATQSDYLVGLGTVTAFFAVWGQSWNILGGLAGKVSLGHSAFIAVAAYVTVILFQRFQLAPVIGLILGVAITVVLAALIGVATLRLSGPYFSLATLAVAAVLLSLIVHFKELTGGANGLSIPFATTHPAQLEFEDPKVYYAIAVTLLMAVTLIVLANRRSRLGLYMAASGESEAAAAAAGVRIAAVRIMALCVSAALTAVGGVLYVFFAGFADPSFLSGLELSIDIALIAVIGGRGYLAGPIVGAIFFQGVKSAANTYTGSSGGWDVLILGLVVVWVVLIEPRGLIAMAARIFRFAKRGVTRRPLEATT